VQVTWISITLAASPTSLPANNSATVTATASLDVGPTPFFIEVFDQTTGAAVVICGSGATCSSSVTQSSAGEHFYTAFVSAFSTTTPPPNIRATSNTVGVTWTPVTVFVSVPNLIGETDTQAGQTLQAAGLTLGNEFENGCVDDGHVHVQSPGAGSSVAAGSSVDIGMGTPPPPGHFCP
jgi:hypothetical protein